MLVGILLGLSLLTSLVLAFLFLRTWHATASDGIAVGAGSDEKRKSRLAALGGWLGATCGVVSGTVGVVLLLNQPDIQGWIYFDQMEGIGTLGAAAGWTLSSLIFGFAIPEER